MCSVSFMESENVVVFVFVPVNYVAIYIYRSFRREPHSVRPGNFV